MLAPPKRRAMPRTGGVWVRNGNRGGDGLYMWVSDARTPVYLIT